MANGSICRSFSERGDYRYTFTTIGLEPNQGHSGVDCEQQQGYVGAQPSAWAAGSGRPWTLTPSLRC